MPKIMIGELKFQEAKSLALKHTGTLVSVKKI